MAHTDSKFPHLSFSSSMSPTERGNYHGEEYASEIRELGEIRRELMLQKSPHLTSKIEEYANEQYDKTKKDLPSQWEELEGIRSASNLTISQIVVLNNYTDFRDIHLPDEGCTTVGLKGNENISGQTWDMHGSAKNYVCTMEVPGQWISFSLLGCVGMMGANKDSLFVGVNNINTTKAKNGIIWPALIRHLLEQSNFSSLRNELIGADVTSGHNYLISNGKQWENWEIGTSFKRKASEVTTQNTVIFHTNHCIDAEAIKHEEKLSLNSTSLNRYSLMEKKAPDIQDMNDTIKLLQDHEEYPKSICSHFQANAQDPSSTCGGAVFNHNSKSFFLWRCCPKDPERYINRELKL